MIMWSVVLAAVLSLATAGTEQSEQGTYALNHTGSAAKGGLVFERLGCANCHEYQGRLGSGPNLTGIGSRYDREEIIRSILEPSARFADGWRPVKVVLLDGSSVVGRLQGKETGEVVKVLTGAGEVVHIARERIETVELGTTSPMPDGLTEGVSKEDFADLVAWLMAK